MIVNLLSAIVSTLNMLNSGWVTLGIYRTHSNTIFLDASGRGVSCCRITPFITETCPLALKLMRKVRVRSSCNHSSIRVFMEIYIQVPQRQQDGDNLTGKQLNFELSGYDEFVCLQHALFLEEKFKINLEQQHGKNFLKCIEHFFRDFS